MPSGGKRARAGHPKTPLAERLLAPRADEKPTRIKFDAPIGEVFDEDIPAPSKYLSGEQNPTMPALRSVEVYKKTWAWIKARGCIDLIPVDVIERYAMACARWIQAEEMISQRSLLSKGSDGGLELSPFVKASEIYAKQSNTLWLYIYQIIKDNCTKLYTGPTPQDDVMEQLLNTHI